MAIDKNKIIEAATKYVQKGQYDKAIKEYTKLLEADPKDARIQQKLGELYQKKGENGLAADCFLKVAESYSADGFFLKAVAVYKQVLKLNPNLVDVNLRLAELHQQLGLMSDAMAQYQLVVAHYDKTGNTRASLDTLRKMVDLDPDNIASRIKLAELYAREGMNPEAIGEFQHAAEYLKRNNRVDDYVKVAERLVFLDPSNLELTRELAAIYLAKQDTKRALAKLQLCFKADPKDVETLSMLAQAFKELGQVSKTVSVYKELARIYDDQDRVDDERAIWKKIYELAPDDPDACARMAPKQAAPAPAAPAPVAPARAPVASGPAAAAAPAAQAAAGKPSPEAISKLLTETDVYVKYGLHEKAIEHLKKVFAIDPQSVEGHEKAFALNNATGNQAAATESLVMAVRFAIAKSDLDRARANLQTLCERDPAHAAIPQFLEAVGGLAPAEEIAEIEEDAILVEAVDEEVEVAPEPPQVDLSRAGREDPFIAASDDDDDAALAAAAESLAEDEVVDEIVSDSDEELIAAPPDDEAAINASLVDEPFGDDLVEDLSGDYGEPSIDVLDSPEVPFEAEPVDAPSADPFAVVDDEEDFERDPQEEATRVAYLPSLMAEQAASESAPAADWQNEEGNADETAVLPAAVAVQSEFAEPEAGPWENEEGNAEVTSVMPILGATDWQNEEGNSEVTSVLPAVSPEELLAVEPAAEEFVAELPPPDEEVFAEDVASQPEPDETDFSDVDVAEPIAEDVADGLAIAAAAEEPAAELVEEPAQDEFIDEPPAAEEETPPPDAVDEQESPFAAAPPAEPVEPEAPAELPPEPAAEEEASVAASEPEEQPEPVAEAPAEEEEEPAGDELDEAAFFIEQGVLEEAREILETVLLAYPKSARAAQLMSALEAKERGEEPPAEAPAEPAPEPASEPASEPAPEVAAAPSSGDIAFDLASELASEDLGGTESSGGSDDFQVSFEDVFSEFKKGVEKIVRPEDVDTHYDLGIAYKEMGLIDDAVGEFEQALSAAAGKKKEIECLTMIGLCRLEREQFKEAVEAFKRGLESKALTPETGKALNFELGCALEKVGDLPRALRHLADVEKLDPKYRDVHSITERLRAQGVEPLAEESAPAPAAATPRPRTVTGSGVAASPARKPAAGPAKPAAEPDRSKKSSKIGYV